MRGARRAAFVVGLLALSTACGGDDDGIRARTSGDDAGEMQQQERDEQRDDSRDTPMPPAEDDDEGIEDVEGDAVTGDEATEEPPPGGGSGQLEDPDTATTTTTAAPAPPRTEPQPPPAPSSGSGVSGVVTLGPQCPVVAEGESCPDDPADGAQVQIRRATASVDSREAGGGEVVASTTAGGDGRFQVALAAGDYVAEAEAPGAMSCERVGFTVHDGRYTEVRIACDTGMR